MKKTVLFFLILSSLTTYAHELRDKDYIALDNLLTSNKNFRVCSYKGGSIKKGSTLEIRKRYESADDITFEVNAQVGSVHIVFGGKIIKDGRAQDTPGTITINKFITGKVVGVNYTTSENASIEIDGEDYNVIGVNKDSIIINSQSSFIELTTKVNCSFKNL